MITLKKTLLVIFAVMFLAGCATRAPYVRLDPALQGAVCVINGYQYVPLVKLCDTYGISCEWDTFTKTASLKSGSTSIVLRGGSEGILVDGFERGIERPVIVSGGTVFVPVSFARNTIAPLAASAVTRRREAAPERPKKFTIHTVVLDTGHGGKDPGAIGRGKGTKEKDVALILSKKIKGLLEDAGMRVVMLRSNDTFISLPRRAELANESGADIFVSIHMNASSSRSMRGFECYYLSTATDDTARALQAFEDSSLKLNGDADAQRSTRLDKTLWDMTLTENRKESAELAGMICRSVEESQLLRNNGPKTARFYVLKNIRIPSVLVENGYISNRAEELKIRDPKFLGRLAEAIVRGILRYKARYEETEGFTNV
ncbi:MAG: N-acetylmuramoyl-L-alanine amidase [Candidatus Omnitrophica bacterium]|nr:N-acetylmuramoyl-L-alanine amidase [Candidatus Omnitrophota bacterium]